MDKAAILNYPGSKRRLLDFILSNSQKYLSEGSVVLDIFCGTGSVAKMYKEAGFKVYANDSENYSKNIVFSLLNGATRESNLKFLVENYRKKLLYALQRIYTTKANRNCERPKTRSHIVCLQHIIVDPTLD